MAYFHCVVGSGGGGEWDDAIIKVYAPFAQAVKITKGTDERTETAHYVSGNFGEAIFYIHAEDYGTWTVSTTLDSTTLSDTVTVSDNAMYEVTLGYKLVCTCDAAFSGTIIRATCGVRTYQDTCPSSSPYVITWYTIPTGTYTITGTVSGTTYETTVTTVSGTHVYDQIRLSVFTSTITASFPSGTTECTCSDGTTTYYASASELTALSAEFEVHDSGTWTVECTNGSSTASDTVSITSSGQSESITLSYLVPSAYQQVEYLQSSGTQYINTNKIIDLTTEYIEADIMYVGASTLSTEGTLFGTRTGAAFLYFTKSTSANQYRMLAKGGGDKLFTNTDLSTAIQNLKINSGTLYINDVSITTFNSSACNLVSFLFARNYNGNADWFGNWKIERFTIKSISDDSNILDFVPCYRKSDSVAGMWETVGETFYTNDGSGTFIVGGDV